MAKVAVIVDNEKDLNYTENLKEVMDNLGISYDIKIISGMDSLEEIDKFLDEIEDKGVSVIIVLAGVSTHLPGIIASKTIIPVIGVALPSNQISSTDSLFSLIQMPEGVPVACMSFGKAGVKNASILAGEILALNDLKIRERLIEYKSHFK